MEIRVSKKLPHKVIVYPKPVEYVYASYKTQEAALKAMEKLNKNDAWIWRYRYEYRD
jgi:hypothetical protein